MVSRKDSHGFKAEQLLQASFDAIQDGISILDSNLQILRVNKVMEQLYSHAMPLVGKKCFEAYHLKNKPCEVCPSLEAIRTGEMCIEEVPLTQPEGQTGWLELFAYPIKDDEGGVSGVVELIRNITEEKERESAAAERAQRALRQRASLVKLTSEPALLAGDLTKAAKALTEITSQALEVERTSMWLLSDDGSELECLDLYELSKKDHSSGMVLQADNYPSYFEAINKESRVYADHTYEDPRTSEFAATYLDPHNIKSMLDAGIFVEGKLVGVFSFEHVGETRRWHVDDESFASTVAAIAAQVIETARRLEAEIAKAESEKRYAILFQSSADPLFIMKEEFIDCNEEACRYFGYNREEIIGHPPKDFSPEYQPDGRKSAEATAGYLKAALEGISQKFYWQHMHRSGELLDTEVRLRKAKIDGEAYIIAAVRDISERLKAEEIIKQGRDWYRALAEDIPVLVTRISTDGKITYVNESSRTIIGLPVEEIIGKDFYTLVPSEYRNQVKKSFKALTPEDPVVTVDHNNKGRLFRWKNRAIFNPDRTIKEYFTVGEDITEQHDAEQKLKDSETRNRALVNAIPDKIFRYDREGRYLDYKVKYESQLTEKARELYRNNQLLGSRISDIFDKSISAILMQGIEKALSSGMPQVLEYSYTTQDEKRHFEARLVSAGADEVISIVRDITDRHQSLELLKESEERYREILATIEEGYYEADLSGVITFCNDAAGRLFGGYSQKELIGMSYEKLYKNPELAYKTFNRVFMTGVPEKGLILEMIKKDRTINFGEISISLVRDKVGFITGFKGIGKDVTERIEYEKRLEFLSLHDQLTGIHNRVYYESELERLEGGRDYPITIITADLDGLKLINDTLGHDTGDQLLCRCAALLRESLRQSDLLARIGGDEFSAILRRTDHSTGETIMRRIREKINLINQDGDDVPLGVSIGMATAEGKETSLKGIYKQADDSMYRDKLYSSSSSRGKIVQSLLAALAERDYITEGHARRLEDLCRAVGEKIDLSSHQLADLALLAQVHDLGKVGIPDQILYKPGPLNKDEWEVMRGHPEKGYRIASASPDLAGVADLILKHHERWDGSGYPLGLKEKEIPVECRILAINDAFDAMTNKRPYNKVKSQEEALAEIKRGSGSQFDPDLVAIFLSVINET